MRLKEKNTGINAILKKLSSILIGWFNYFFNKEEKMSKERLYICVGCKKNISGVCSMCGCPLVAKSRVKDEVCDLDKWP